MDLPKLSQETLHYVDLTPSDDLAIRILKAYLENTRTKWHVEELSQEHVLIYEEMNKHQDQRAEILQRAIKILEANK